jgi:predicted nuclease of predicted toxin-antitoxin system
MKLLFDQNLSFKLCQALADHAKAITAFEQDTTATCLEIL